MPGLKKRRWWILVLVASLVLGLIHSAFYLRGHLKDRGYLSTLIDHIPSEATDEERLLQTLEIAFDIPPHRPTAPEYGLTDPLLRALRPSATLIHERGGHCAKRSRLLLVLLRLQRIPARKLYLFNEKGMELLSDPPRQWVHAVVEARIEDRWVVADPLFKVVFHRPDGSLATAEEIRNDRDVLSSGRNEADERFDHWEDVLYDYQDVRRAPWFAVPFAQRLYAGLGSIIPRSALANISTPYLLELPHLAAAVAVMLFWTGTGLAGALVLKHYGRRT